GVACPETTSEHDAGHPAELEDGDAAHVLPADLELGHLEQRRVLRVVAHEVALDAGAEDRAVLRADGDAEAARGAAAQRTFEAGAAAADAEAVRAATDEDPAPHVLLALGGEHESRAFAARAAHVDHAAAQAEDAGATGGESEVAVGLARSARGQLGF